jgi:hypothetical protein
VSGIQVSRDPYIVQELRNLVVIARKMEVQRVIAVQITRGGNLMRRPKIPKQARRERKVNIRGRTNRWWV